MESTNRDVHDDAIVLGELLLMLATDIQVGAGRPGPSEVELLVDAVPFPQVEVAGGERIYAGACDNGDIRDDEAGMVCGHVAMDRVGEDPVIAVEEEDDEEGR